MRCSRLRKGSFCFLSFFYKGSVVVVFNALAYKMITNVTVGDD